jgi:hypothetical protein
VLADGVFLSDGTLNMAILKFKTDQLGKGLDYRAYRDGGSIARNRDDDRRCQPVCADGAGAVPAQEGAPEVPLVRAFRA